MCVYVIALYVVLSSFTFFVKNTPFQKHKGAVKCMYEYVDKEGERQLKPPLQHCILTFTLHTAVITLVGLI